MRQWGTKLARLRGMGMAELACRGRQESSALLERWGFRGSADGLPESVFRDLREAPDLVSLQRTVRKGDLEEAARRFLARFREVAPARFFPGAVEPGSSDLVVKIPGAREAILREVEAILGRRFDLLGYRGLFFGDPIDWHLDPVSGRRSPLVHWRRIDPLDPDVVGDSKVVWELNRHQWMVRLAQAYRLTGEESYVRVIAGHVRDWKRANPRGMGINWASSLEAALRLISWCWVLFLVRDSRALDRGLFLDLVAAIHAHAAHVEKYLSYYFSPNTHLTGEALGLFYAGALFPEMKSAERWRQSGMRILIEQIERQVFPDGVYFEQTTCYQRYTAEIYLHFLILAERNGIAVPEKIREHVARLLDFLVAVRRPNGSLPSIGDADGGWLLPLVRREPDDLRGVFSTAAALFGREDYAWVAEGVAPETAWLLGERGCDAFAALRPSPPPGEPSRVFPHGGYAVMRSSWEPAAHHLIYDVGPLGCPVGGGHGHADLLSIQCSVYGEPFLVDSGTYCYTPDREWRTFFRASGAHSTVMVDGVSQAIPDGPFRWISRPRAQGLRWAPAERFHLAEAEHEAYRRLADPVTHRRRVLFIDRAHWILIDELEGAAEHDVELRFQFAPMTVHGEDSLWARAVGQSGSGLLVRAFAAVPLSARVHLGERSPAQGWVSPDYGQLVPAPALVYSTRARLPLSVLTVLLPVRPSDAPTPSVSVTWSADGRPERLVFGDGERWVRFLGEEPFVELS